jgi:hypothetical protein
MRSLSCTFVVLVACAELGGGPGYDADARAIDTGEVVPELLCAPRGSIPDAFGCECSDACMSSVCATEEESLASELRFGLPQGQCIRACLDDGGCNPGYLCVLDGSGAGFCVLRCTDVEECPFANTCGPPMTGMPTVCIPKCQADSDCRGGRCDRWTGSCGGESDPSLGGIGAPCRASSQCRGEVCIDNGENVFCSARCSVARQGCPDGAVCIDDDNGDDEGICLSPCTSVADCQHMATPRCGIWPEAGDRGGCI